MLPYTHLISNGSYSDVDEKILFLVHVTDNLVPVVINVDHYYRTVYVPIHDQVISSAHVPHNYWDIYENIS